MVRKEDPTKNSAERIVFFLAAMVLSALVSAGTAAAQSNTLFGTGALASPLATNLNDSAFGFNALHSPTSGFDNTASGAFALFSNGTGARNTAAGVGALQANTVGSENTATGTHTLTENTTGDDNTATGANALFSNISGVFNTATGAEALQNNTAGASNTATGALALENDIGGENTATGAEALEFNTTGFNDTATGAGALFSNTTGIHNTATGASALFSNTAGSFNTAAGEETLFFNTTGHHNTATGAVALENNTTGANNTASGFQALNSNTTGIDETATGTLALRSNTTGLFNTADGFSALAANTTGGLDTAAGVNALLKNTTGQRNTAVGVNTMLNNTTGSNNIGLGFLAGANLTTGTNNIDVGSTGVAAESRTIRIGTQGTQTATFIAGISGSAATGSSVVVNSTGKLGIVMSSARFKRDIRDMGSSSGALMKLRPVTFRYRNDPEGIRQYGLVAEEVARIYPELVSYGADGKVETVNYLTLTSMLLNELQKRTAENHRQAERLTALSCQMAAQRAAFERRLSTLEQTMAATARAPRLATALSDLGQHYRHVIPATRAAMPHESVGVSGDCSAERKPMLPSSIILRPNSMRGRITMIQYR